MKQAMLERRRLLRSTATWVAGLAGIALVRPARALEMQSMSPASPLGVAYANHCGGPSDDHTALMAELQAALAKDPSAQSLSATCPLCGCPVIVTR
jgi:hypothetical protein